MSGVVDSLLTNLGPLAVLVVMAVVFAETGLLAGFFLPGDSLLFTAGVLVSRQVIGLPIWVVIAAASVAAVLGDQTGYLVGRRLGPRVLTRPHSRLLDPRHLDRARTFFDRHGPRAVVLARFVPLARTLTPVAAGAGQMPRRTFTVYNVVGGLAWCASLLTAGYLFGGVPFVSRHIELLTLGIVLVSLAPTVLPLIRTRARLAPVFVATGVGLASAGVFGLADAAREHDGPASWDPGITADVVAHRFPLLTQVAETATFLAGAVTLAIATAVILAVLARTHRIRDGVVLAVGMAGAAALTLGVKHAVLRSRPGAADVLGPVDHSYSFPSGHTLMSTVFLALVCWLLWRRLATRLHRVLLVATAVLLEATIGASRLYLGYHWATDIVGAWLVAAAWLGLLFLLASHFPTGTTRRPGIRGSRGAVRAVVGYLSW